MDDIGIGRSMANLTYVIIVFAGVIGLIVLIRKKIIVGSIFWTSLFLNLFFYLFLMGKYFLYPEFCYPIINKYWPIINILLLVFLIFYYFKNKNVKSKNN